jgi:hypothetical protein
LDRNSVSVGQQTTPSHFSGMVAKTMRAKLGTDWVLQDF